MGSIYAHTQLILFLLFINSIYYCSLGMGRYPKCVDREGANVKTVPVPGFHILVHFSAATMFVEV